MTCDRRKRHARPAMITIGALVASMGMYAFGAQDTLFTVLLARMEIEAQWGAIMILTGCLQIASGFLNNRFIAWASNAAVMLVCGWTYLLFALHGLHTPTINNCLILAVGALYTMLKDAFDGRRVRVLRNEYQS